MKTNRTGFTLIELLVGIGIATILISLIVGAIQNYRQKKEDENTPFIKENYQSTNPESDLMVTYSGWVKLTGNPKNITFVEWKALYANGLIQNQVQQ